MVAAIESTTMREWLRRVARDLADLSKGHVRVEPNPDDKHDLAIVAGSIGFVAAHLAFFATRDLWTALWVQVGVQTLAIAAARAGWVPVGQ